MTNGARLSLVSYIRLGTNWSIAARPGPEIEFVIILQEGLRIKIAYLLEHLPLHKPAKSRHTSISNNTSWNLAKEI